MRYPQEPDTGAVGARKVYIFRLALRRQRIPNVRYAQAGLRSLGLAKKVIEGGP